MILSKGPYYTLIWCVAKVQSLSGVMRCMSRRKRKNGLRLRRWRWRWKLPKIKTSDVHQNRRIVGYPCWYINETRLCICVSFFGKESGLVLLWRMHYLYQVCVYVYNSGSTKWSMYSPNGRCLYGKGILDIIWGHDWVIGWSKDDKWSKSSNEIYSASSGQKSKGEKKSKVEWSGLVLVLALEMMKDG